MSKKKKEKVIYYDDNSTVVDMRSVDKNGKPQNPAPRTTFKQKMQTYFAAVKMMIIPMIAVLGAMTIGYVILRLATGR